MVAPALGYNPGEYALLFALVMIGHITGVQIGNRRVLRDGIPRMLRAGAAVSCAGGLLLAGLASMNVSGGAAFALPMAVFMLGNGLIMPNAAAAALSPFPRLAGCASSLQAMLYLVGGALTGVAVSAFLDGTTRPLCAVIGLCGLAVFASERALALRAERRKAVPNIFKRPSNLLIIDRNRVFCPLRRADTDIETCVACRSFLELNDKATPPSLRCRTEGAILPVHLWM